MESKQNISSEHKANKQQKSHKKYEKINAYTKIPSKQQIITLSLFVIHFLFHSIFLVKAIIGIGHPVLSIMWALVYLCLIFMIVDYLILTISDPSDKLLKSDVAVIQNRIKYRKFNNQTLRKRNIQLKSTVQISVQMRYLTDQQERTNPFRTKKCSQCQKLTLLSSYHCSICNRCVQNMDHHCRYLNNCIGGTNYSSFFRLLLSTEIYLLIVFGQSIWIFVSASNDQQINILTFTRWMVLVTLLLTIGLLIAVSSLLVFHIYINCIKDMTTIQYLFRDDPDMLNNVHQKCSSESQHYPKKNGQIDQIKLEGNQQTGDKFHSGHVLI